MGRQMSNSYCVRFMEFTLEELCALGDDLSQADHVGTHQDVLHVVLVDLDHTSVDELN